MPLVEIEGINNIGKSTLIKQLKEKYPSLKSIAFPVDRSILETKYDKTDFKSVIDYHNQFIDDFMDNKETIQELLEISNKDGKENVVLMDRYIISHIVYMISDILNFDKFDSTMEIKEKIYKTPLYNYNINIAITSVFDKIFKDLFKPDLIIYLHPTTDVVLPNLSELSIEETKKEIRSKNKKEKLLLAYHDNILIMKRIGIIPVIEIEGLKKDTFSNVESELKKRGYLPENV